MAERKITQIKDLLYFDIDKASSLLSQLEGGLPQELLLGEEAAEGKQAGVKVDLKLVSGTLGEDKSDKMSSLQKKVLHHDLLDRVEKLLFENNLLVDINKAVEKNNVHYDQLHKIINKSSYIRTEGVCLLNDFERLKNMIDNFDGIAKYLNDNSLYEVKQTEQYVNSEKKIEELNIQLGNTKDRNQKTKLKENISQHKKLIESLLKISVQKIDSLQNWQKLGLLTWIDVFNSNHIHLRLKPFDELSDFEILTNLKTECFTDTDVKHLLFSYGNVLDFKLNLIGLITQVPKDVSSQEQNKEDEIIRDNVSKKDRMVQYREGFNRVFDAMGNMDAFARDPVYPSIKIYPIALYRNIVSNLE